MNTVILMGNTTKDVEIRDAGNTKVANFSLAVPREYKREGQPDTDFHTCTVFGKTAEFMEKHVPKGTRILVKGSLQNNQYTDKEGKSRTQTVVMVERVEFAGAKAGGGNAVVADDDEIPFA